MSDKAAKSVVYLTSGDLQPAVYLSRGERELFKVHESARGHLTSLRNKTCVYNYCVMVKAHFAVVCMDFQITVCHK